MDFDNLDYKILSEALYQLALLDQSDIDSDDVRMLSDAELENRLLFLRRKIMRLANKSSHNDDSYL